MVTYASGAEPYSGDLVESLVTDPSRDLRQGHCYTVAEVTGLTIRLRDNPAAIYPGNFKFVRRGMAVVVAPPKPAFGMPIVAGFYKRRKKDECGAMWVLTEVSGEHSTDCVNYVQTPAGSLRVSYYDWYGPYGELFPDPPPMPTPLPAATGYKCSRKVDRVVHTFHVTTAKLQPIFVHGPVGGGRWYDEEQFREEFDWPIGS